MSYTVAVLGAGQIALSHLKALGTMEQLEAVAVADIARERVTKVAGAYGLKAYTDYKVMIESERPDIAVITLPHFLHKEAAIYCAERGCHLLLEKPMAMNGTECDEILEVAELADVRLMVGHTQQFLAINRQAQHLLHTIQLGPLVQVQDLRHTDYFIDERPAWFLERRLSGGGVVMNLGAHEVDKIVWLTGEEIHKVSARLSYYADRGDVEGSGMLYLETKSGVPISISLSGYAKEYRNELLLVYRDGEITIDLKAGEIWIRSRERTERIPLEPAKSPFVLQFRQLLGAIEAGEAPECSGIYGHRIIRIIDAIYKSQETGREVYL